MAEKKLTVDETTISKAQRDKKILDYLFTIVGFGLCRAWIVYCLSSSTRPEVLYPSKWIFLISGALVALFVAFTIRRLKESTERTRRSLFIATGISLALCAIIIPFATSQKIELLLFTGFIIGGIGAGMLQVLWGERFAAYEVRFATVVSPAAAILTAALVAFTPIEVGFMGYTLFPLFSFALLIVMADRTGIKVKKLIEPRNWSLLEADTSLIDKKTSALIEEKTDLSHTQEAENTPKEKSFDLDVVKLMFSIMVFSFLCRAFGAVPFATDDPFAFFGGSSLFSLVVVGVIFLLFAAFLRDRFNPTFTYRLSLPIMVAGYVILALFVDTHAALSLLLINIGYEFFDILAWILFTEVSRRKDENPLHIFGLGVAFMFFGMATGYLGGEIMHTLVMEGSVQITVIAMLSILSLVIIGFLVIPEGTIEHLAHAIKPDKKTSNEKDAKEEAPGGKRLEVNCVAVAKAYRLTPRESEVLVLLAHGRTLSIIARDLQIAKGTARTHIENIYRKLNVHKQQELIDLVEGHELS